MQTNMAGQMNNLQNEMVGQMTAVNSQVESLFGRIEQIELSTNTPPEEFDMSSQKDDGEDSDCYIVAKGKGKRKKGGPY